MPTPIPTPYVTGDPMDAAQVEVDLEAARTWLNGDMLETDFVDESLGRESIYRPDIGLIPRPWVDGETQKLLDNQRSLDASSYPRFAKSVGRGVGQLEDRYDLFPSAQQNNGGMPVRGLGRRMYLEAPCEVQITAVFFALAVCAATYDDRAGYFQLRYRRVEDDYDGVGTTIDGARRYLWSREERGSFAIFGHLDVADAGTYDFFITYHPAAAAADVRQVTVAQATFVVEVHREA